MPDLHSRFSYSAVSTIEQWQRRHKIQYINPYCGAKMDCDASQKMKR